MPIFFGYRLAIIDDGGRTPYTIARAIGRIATPTYCARHLLSGPNRLTGSSPLTGSGHNKCGRVPTTTGCASSIHCSSRSMMIEIMVFLFVYPAFAPGQLYSRLCGLMASTASDASCTRSLQVTHANQHSASGTLSMGNHLCFSCMNDNVTELYMNLIS
jgi:hypothetical protein